MASISDNIRTLREARKWTKGEMAKRLGFKSYTTITKWESGKNHPQGFDLVRICELFGVSSDYLLGISDENRINYYKYYPVEVSAGLLESIDTVKEDDVQWIAVQDEMLGKHANSTEIYFVNVSGTSMNKVIKPNSRIAVKKLCSFKDLKDSDIVLFSKDNEFSIKRYYNDINSARFIFRPESTDTRHVDIVVPYSEAEKIEIHGKVILTIEQYE